MPAVFFYYGSDDLRGRRGGARRVEPCTHSKSLFVPIVRPFHNSSPPEPAALAVRWFVQNAATLRDV